MCTFPHFHLPGSRALKDSCVNVISHPVNLTFFVSLMAAYRDADYPKVRVTFVGVGTGQGWTRSGVGQGQG